MALKIETTIRDMCACHSDDFATPSHYDILVGLEEDGLPVTIDCCATDGYYDVTTPSGVEIPGLSWVHLDGFNENGPVL